MQHPVLQVPVNALKETENKIVDVWLTILVCTFNCLRHKRFDPDSIFFLCHFKRLTRSVRE